MPPQCLLTQDVEFAQWAGLLEHQPGVHAVSVEFMLAGQHPEPLQGWERGSSQGAGLQVGSLGPYPSLKLGN